MACHVYDLAYYIMMTIVVYDVPFENTKVKQIMWTKINEMMLEHMFPKSNFNGFMANSAHQTTDQTWVVKSTQCFFTTSRRM
jgi:hypothetical protein